MIHSFQKPVLKKVTEMQPGDYFRCEFENFGHYASFVFESCEPLHQNTKITCHRVGCASQVIVNFDSIENCTFEVIGKEVEV